MYLMNTLMREYDINVFAHQTGRLQEDSHSLKCSGVQESDTTLKMCGVFIDLFIFHLYHDVNRMFWEF